LRARIPAFSRPCSALFDCGQIGGQQIGIDRGEVFARFADKFTEQLIV
jgi:hypothetical protein